MEPTTGVDRRLLHRVAPMDFLSFGPDAGVLDLAALNILIGANGSGKSNFMEAIAIMRATPVPSTSAAQDFWALLRRGGGPQEWCWKGSTSEVATIALHFGLPGRSDSVRHVLAFEAGPNPYGVVVEMIETLGPEDDANNRYFAYEATDKQTGFRTQRGAEWTALKGIRGSASVLAQLRDPEAYPVFTSLALAYENIRIYREWSFGRNTIFRYPQRADMRNDRLEEDFSNLGLFLSRLGRNPSAKARLLAALKDLYEGIQDYQVVVEGGSVQVFFTEGEFSIPATRLSDGTLRYLCLLAILCDPEPPPLICIEEPELGLHPDILPKLADLLVEASGRTQLIVTTHSDVLVDAMTERPECVVVCEKHEGSTVMKRLNREDLSQWLEKYRLGQLWLSGQIGGTRW